MKINFENYLNLKDPTPVFEASIESNVTEVEEVFQTTTLDTLIKDIEIIETTTPELETTDSDIKSNKDCSKCIDTKFLNHYYAKGCKPIPNSNGCDNCPKKFDCNQKTNITFGNNGLLSAKKILFFKFN
jgi:hypothetical protein